MWESVLSLQLPLLIFLNQFLALFFAIPDEYPYSKTRKNYSNENHHWNPNYLSYFFFILIIHEHLLALLPSFNSQLWHYHSRAALVLALILCENNRLATITFQFIPIIITVCFGAVLETGVSEAQCTFVGLLIWCIWWLRALGSYGWNILDDNYEIKQMLSHCWNIEVKEVWS